MSFPTSPTNGQIYGNKKYNSTKNVWENCLQLPIGFIYTQLPGESDPATLYGGNWTNISSKYAGGFLRIEGGNASTFNSGLQAGQNKSHSHSASSGTESADHSHSFSGSTDAGTLTSVQSTNASGSGTTTVSGGTAGSVQAYQNWSHTHGYSGSTGGRSATHTHTITVNSDGGTEVRPDNYTIRIWKRTA